MSKKIVKKAVKKTTSIQPKTQMQALKIVARVWAWLLRKNPAIFTPLTFYLLFGGGIFAWKYFGADKVNIQMAKPLSEQVKLSLVPEAKAGGDRYPPIVFNKQVYGYEDTTLVAKVRADAPEILVYDKIRGKVWTVAFEQNIKYQMRK